MRFELFAGKNDPRVFCRLWGYYLIHIPSPEEAVKYFGADWMSQIKKVDNINDAGIIVEDKIPPRS